MRTSLILSCYQYAMALAWLGRLEEAVMQYTGVIGVKPDYARAHNNLGVVLARLHRIEEAITHFSKALRIAADFQDARRNLRRAQTLAGSGAL